MPVGRLDADTTGALLLTNDGAARAPARPPALRGRQGLRGRGRGRPDEEALRRLREGVELEDGRTAPARARRLATGRVELTLHEGRKHQVKRMLEAVGHPVRRLHRSRYAGLDLRGLAPGEWRELTKDEVAATSRACRLLVEGDRRQHGVDPDERRALEA